MVFTPNLKRKQTRAGTLLLTAPPSVQGVLRQHPGEQVQNLPKTGFSSPCTLSFLVTLFCMQPPPFPPPRYPTLSLSSLTLKEFITEESKKITAESLCVTGESAQH